jgi:hypothetical protein
MFLTLTIAICVSLLVELSYSLPSKLVYRFTARDFMQAGCMKGTLFPSDIDNFWFANPSAISGNPRNIGDVSSCPIRLDIIDGKFSGHPDFEAKRAMYGEGK